MILGLDEALLLHGCSEHWVFDWMVSLLVISNSVRIMGGLRLTIGVWYLIGQVSGGHICSHLDIFTNICLAAL